MPSSAFDRIKILCLEVEGIPESELISQLKSILRANPDVQYEQDEQDDWGRTILHYAVDKRSVEFTKLLVEDSNLVKTANNYGQLPIHFACHHGNVEVAKYLYSIYPESINIATMNGNYPIHCVLRSHARSSGHEDLTRFLLLHDQGAVLTASTIDSSFCIACCL
jgi:ankyrin repeat protein